MTDTVTVPVAEYEDLRRRALRQHCLPDCGHDHHYFVIEVQVGPLTENTIDPQGVIARLFHRVAVMAQDYCEDADVSGIMLSPGVLGLEDSE